ncbi:MULTISPECIES: hypothetical protein [Natronococcus]|uniref:Uncharacterized protein n=1 Tax=Natronococcus jeotgali DSM 18795 TaxID=1227498 RepID=L9X265_9EURY|nr:MULTISPECIES: hypothetical protein [Natronococcus]ELY55820.1 hypothetical protein C492_15221 [Natronococcus jeotgali DSM 18795]NKE36526.1 hypothetical protein [Natronococcus sp. JC468]
MIEDPLLALLGIVIMVIGVIWMRYPALLARGDDSVGDEAVATDQESDTELPQDSSAEDEQAADTDEQETESGRD